MKTLLLMKYQTKILITKRCKWAQSRKKMEIQNANRQINLSLIYNQRERLSRQKRNLRTKNGEKNQLLRINRPKVKARAAFYPEETDTSRTQHHDKDHSIVSILHLVTFHHQSAKQET